MDYLYSKKIFNFDGETIEFNGAGSNTITFPNQDMTAKEVLDYIIANAPVGNVVTIEEYITITNSVGLTEVNFSTLELANLVGFINIDNTYSPAQVVIEAPTWGYRLPRTSYHDLASLQGGFKERSPIELFRQQESKVTGDAVYSTNFKVRRGFTHTYRLDYSKITYFDNLLAIWKDQEITATSEDMNILDGVLISTDSGNVTQIYETQNIFETTITLLGEASGN